MPIDVASETVEVLNGFDGLSVLKCHFNGCSLMNAEQNGRCIAWGAERDLR